MRWKSGGLVAALVLLVGATACSQGPGRPPELEGEIDITLPNDPAVCDPLGGERCLLPFPNDYFAVTDRRTATGHRVDVDRAATPANASGVHIDPTELNRNDGFSPGSAIAVLLPGLDAGASGLAPITDMARSLDGDAPIVLLDATTGRRHPYWAELDSRAPDDAHRLLFVRPAETCARATATWSPSGTWSTAPAPPSPRRRCSGPTATGSAPTSPRSRPGGPTSRACSAHSGGPASTAATWSWPGTSRWPAAATCPSGCWPCATTPSGSSATPPPPSP